MYSEKEIIKQFFAIQKELEAPLAILVCQNLMLVKLLQNIKKRIIFDKIIV